MYHQGRTDQSITEGPALQGARLAGDKIINDVLIIHSNTCRLTRVNQLYVIKPHHMVLLIKFSTQLKIVQNHVMLE